MMGDNIELRFARQEALKRLFTHRIVFLDREVYNYEDMQNIITKRLRNSRLHFVIEADQMGIANNWFHQHFENDYTHLKNAGVGSCLVDVKSKIRAGEKWIKDDLTLFTDSEGLARVVLSACSRSHVICYSMHHRECVSISKGRKRWIAYQRAVIYGLFLKKRIAAMQSMPKDVLIMILKRMQ